MAKVTRHTEQSQPERDPAGSEMQQCPMSTSKAEVCLMNCPYSADIVTIKVKLEHIDSKLDGIVNCIHDNETRTRSLETAQAKANAMEDRDRWDFRSTMLVAMFVLTIMGLVASWIKDIGS